jgi:AbrB family looped-hinge helix DNA binding protein
MATKVHRTRVSKRNQVTIPAEMLREIGVAPGEAVEVSENGDTITVRKAEDPIEAARGFLRRTGEWQVVDEVVKAALKLDREEAATARYLRSFER